MEIKKELLKDLAGSEILDDLFLKGLSREPTLSVKGKETVQFTNWDLLGFYSRREVCQAAAQISDSYGFLSGSSRSGGGYTHLNSLAESRLAQFFGGERAVLFPTKNQAVLTIITALFNELDIISYSGKALSPVVDACALVNADFTTIPVSEPIKFAEKCVGKRRVCSFVETISPLTALNSDVSTLLAQAALCGSWLVVDETYAVGFSGLRGAGSSDVVQWHPTLLARFASLTIPFGLPCAVVVGSKELIDLITSRSRYLGNEFPESAAVMAAVIAAIEVSELSVAERDKLISRVELIQGALRSQGWAVASSSGSPFVSIQFASSKEVREARAAFLQRGILLDIATSHSRGSDVAFLRVLITNRHTDEQVTELLESFSQIKARITPS